jgi:hypothetical protein
MGGQETRGIDSSPHRHQGPRKWCNGIDDDNNMLMSHKFVDNDLGKAFSGVPCRAEFFRYVQWHNMVISMQRTSIFFDPFLRPSP